MKKNIIAICGLLLGGSIVLSSCGKSEAQSSDDSTAGPDTTVAQMYEYEQDVPLPVDASQAAAMQTSASSMPYVVDFSATWCGPCRKLKPYFHRMEQTFKGKAEFATVDIDENPQLADQHGVEAVPTVIIFKDKSMRQELYRITGFNPQVLEMAILDNI